MFSSKQSLPDWEAFSLGVCRSFRTFDWLFNVLDGSSQFSAFQALPVALIFEGECLLRQSPQSRCNPSQKPCSAV